MPYRIVSHPSTQEYRDNYDRVFGTILKGFMSSNPNGRSTMSGPMTIGSNLPMQESHQDAHSEPRLNDQAI